MTADQLKNFMTNEAKLGLGLWYGEESKDHVRMNIACPRTIVEQALLRLKAAVDTLQ
ncbi:hypothetical protein N4T77_00570 [Clostridium sp. CX1]|nr:hypothetical protein [Clostridium sp. CX1]MCT8975083.1 hypothetical protein [Clostridium sp. CX1]